MKGKKTKSLRKLMSLNGRVALITGGAGHIGSVVGETLAELGADIVILDISRDQCIKTSWKIARNYAVKSFPLAVDLTDEKQIMSVPDKITKKLKRLDIVVNCAALVGTSQLKGWATSFKKQKISSWKKAFEVNLIAPFLLTQACMPVLKLSGHGSIINISSIYGMLGPDMRLYKGTSMGGNPAAYATSKGGLIQLTRWLATILAPKIRVNAITVGGVWRDQDEVFHRKYIEKTPLKRMATEEDLKGVVAYLSSDLSSYVTGQNIIVDGGWSAW